MIVILEEVQEKTTGRLMMVKIFKDRNWLEWLSMVFALSVALLTIVMPNNDGVISNTEVVFIDNGIEEVITFPEPILFMLDPLATASFIEEPGDEFNSVMYALEPIGRYYITAYSDLETGGKLTASGGTVHEGVITTCASDTKVLKFGTYIEVGGKLYRCEDTGSAVKGKHIDIYIHDLKKVKNYNSHHETIYRVTFPFGKPGDSYGDTL